MTLTKETMTMSTPKKYNINHLRELESESMFIMREVAAQFENPALLFSGGKDSIVMVDVVFFWS
jgi:3'-phosphoadenosine 5'-phosphosulfate sulfotransferase (PAPS reductase)/FAD synthetase